MIQKYNLCGIDSEICKDFWGLVSKLENNINQYDVSVCLCEGKRGLITQDHEFIEY